MVEQVPQGMVTTPVTEFKKGFDNALRHRIGQEQDFNDLFSLFQLRILHDSIL